MLRFFLRQNDKIIEKIPELKDIVRAGARVDELYDILKLRSTIFVIEQNCVYLDADGKDQKALHLFGKLYHLDL